MSTFSFNYSTVNKASLTPQYATLLLRAEEALLLSYSPYSRFRVGAALLLANGSYRLGANQENASYPAGICAERAAIAGINPLNPEHKIVAIAITYSTEGHFDSPVAPCGICRQVLLEIEHAQQSAIEIYLSSPSGRVLKIDTAEHLLPFHFSKGNLD
ncbi:MAG: cytidine deaminase [Chitinophagia bacterium]|nr:cytidine deaminase [Chitinophagia bacterium]